MQYKLLDINTGIVLTRQPEIIEHEFTSLFLEAPAEATAIFENSAGAVLYLPIRDELCIVPVEILDGVIKVSVVIFDGSARPQKWVCEELIAKTLQDGSILIMPNDTNIPQRFTELQIENQDLRDRISKLESRIKKLEDKFEDVFEGHNYI